MANLETLELTINANAASAKQGITDLATSLASLSTVVARAATDLKNLNAQLAILKGFGVKLPNISPNTPGKGTMYSKEQALGFVNSAKKSELLMMKMQGLTASFVNNAMAGKLSNEQIGSQALNIKNLTEKYDNFVKKENEFVPLSDKLKSGFKTLTENASNFFGKVKRIATTMLIRSAIKALIKSMKEGVNNLYGWSKLNNGEFAQSLDTLKSKVQELKNSMGASISPVLTAAIPVLNAIASAAITAFNAVNQLMALLSGKSSWTKATQGANEFADAAKGAGGAAQEWLAKWDELNVMSSGGGGGGGKAVTDYSDMFEEVFSFDKKIRDLANFLKDNAESIKDMAIATGVAIFGWKLSKAFAETLPFLSKLAGLISLGAVIAITLQADWMLTNEYLKTGEPGWLIASALTDAVGATAAYAIAKKIAGGAIAKYTVGFTLIVAAWTDIIANIKRTDIKAFSKQSLWTTIKAALVGGVGVGFIAAAMGAGIAGVLTAAGGGALFIFALGIGLKLLTSSDDIEWGNIELTEEQVDTYVKEKMFDIDVDATISTINTTIEETAIKKEDVSKAVSDILGVLKVVKLGLADSQDYEALKTGVDTIIEKVEGYIKSAKDLGKLTLLLTPTLVGDNETEQGEWFTNYTEGWDVVDQWFKDKGKELGSYFVTNEKGEIVASKPDMIAAVVEQITAVANAGKEAIINGEAFAELSLGMGDFTHTTANRVVELFKQYKESLTSEYTKLVKEQYVKQGELVAKLFAIDPESDAYKKALEDYKKIGERLTSAVQEGVESASASGTELIRSWLSGLNIEADMNSTEWSGLIENMGGSISAAVDTAIDAATGEPHILEAAKLIGLSGWDLLEKESKISLIKALGGLTNSSTISTLKNELNVSASEIISIADWDSFETEQKFNFLNALKEAFGDKGTLEAAKAAGVNIGKLVQAGMNSEDPEIRKQAQEWAKIIKEGTESDPPEVPVGAKVSETELHGVKKDIEDIEANIDATVTVTKVNAPSWMTKAFSYVNDAMSKIQTTIVGRESGGLVSSGDLFVANEGGNAELIGKFGNQTGVANQDQIVSGISQGVSDANREQNALLMQQNNLLREILNKDTSVRIGASAALGRVARQSINMYSSMIGG